MRSVCFISRIFFSGDQARREYEPAALLSFPFAFVIMENAQACSQVEQFIVRECELLRPRQVVLSHHDNFSGAAGAPDLTDLAPVHEELGRVLPRLEVVTMTLGGTATLW